MTGITPQLKKALKLGATPQTILISTQGRVEEMWLGAYDARTAPKIQAVLGVVLPGLLPERVSRALFCPDSEGHKFNPGYIGIVNGERVQCSNEGKWIAVKR